jgi:uncharacterized membrane protein YecN with MAPEG domain
MPWSADQRSIVRDAFLAIAVCAAILAAGYTWLPASWFGLKTSFATADRIAFALQADLAIFLWLAGCVRAVSKGRFDTPGDIGGSASGPPSPALKVRAAVLQNSLEQTVLAVGAHLILATVLRGAELRVIPVLVAVYLLGRATFAWGYAQRPVGRAFGMALTGVSTVVAYGLAVGLLVAGRAGP